jgi:hypothetical protein
MQREARLEAVDRLELSPSSTLTWWSPASTTRKRLSGSASNTGLSERVAVSTWTTREARMSSSVQRGSGTTGV